MSLAFCDSDVKHVASLDTILVSEANRSRQQQSERQLFTLCAKTKALRITFALEATG